MEMHTSEYEGNKVITIGENRIDAAIAVRFKDRMQELSSGSAGRIILDLSSVTFVDSSGLGAVVGSMKQLGRGRRMDLVGLSPSVKKVFRMTRMDSVFRIYDSLEQATQEAVDAT